MLYGNDKQILFIIVLVLLVLFIIQKYTKMILIVLLCGIVYVLYDRLNFASPRDFINYMKSRITETFEPNDTPFDITSDKIINNNNIVSRIPILANYKMFLDKLINVITKYNSDNKPQSVFIIRKLKLYMSNIFNNSYTLITDKSYSMQTYIKLLQAEKDFNDTINIFTFLDNDHLDNTIQNLNKEFTELNIQLNKYIIEHVNTNIDYNITTSILPSLNDPLPANYLL